MVTKNAQVARSKAHVHRAQGPTSPKKAQWQAQLDMIGIHDVARIAAHLEGLPEDWKEADYARGYLASHRIHVVSPEQLELQAKLSRAGAQLGHSSGDLVTAPLPSVRPDYRVESAIDVLNQILLITDVECAEHLDFILNIMPMERLIAVVHSQGVVVLCAPEEYERLVAISGD
jgi:hypothetical protein